MTLRYVIFNYYILKLSILDFNLELICLHIHDIALYCIALYSTESETESTEKMYKHSFDTKDVADIYRTMFASQFLFALKCEQLDILANMINGRNTLSILPTCYGKSMLFILLPLLMNIVSKLYLILFPQLIISSNTLHFFSMPRFIHVRGTVCSLYPR